MQIQIRGSLGTQVLQILLGYAIAYEKKENVKSIKVNAYNYGQEIENLYPELHTDILYFKEVLDFQTQPNVEVVSGTQKVKYNVKSVELLCKHIEKIRKEITIKHTHESSTYENILHVRYLKDRRLCSMETYETVAGQLNNPTIFVDDKNYLERFKDYECSENDTTIGDWLSLSKAKRVYGIPSTFMWTPALLNETLDVQCFHRDMCYPYGFWKEFDVLVRNLQNFNYTQMLSH